MHDICLTNGLCQAVIIDYGEYSVVFAIMGSTYKGLHHRSMMSRSVDKTLILVIYSKIDKEKTIT